MKIVLTTEPTDLALLDKYEELGSVEVFGPTDTLESCPDAEILVTNFLYTFDKKTLDWLRKLKVIATPTTGLDHIDLEECERRGIKVISLKGETEFLKTIPSVAELSIWMMLELLRRPHNGRFMGRQLKDKRICLIGGRGRIGTHVKKRLQGFETLVHLVDRDNPWVYLREYDILSLHVPLNKETEGMIGEEQLKMMKPTAYLINTSRGAIVQREPLLRAIREKWIAGYGTDVVRDDQEMQDLEQLQKEGHNVVLTRHIGGNTVEARQATDEFIFNKVKIWIENKNGI